MNLHDLGYNEKLEKSMLGSDLIAGRVVAEHRERYTVMTEKGECEAEITGNMRFTTRDREDLPAVGDWVALALFDHNFGLIHRILPRASLIKRQAVGRHGEVQVIAANIDFAFLVQAVDRDFNINRLERYLTICHTSGVSPVIVLTKTDLAEEGKTKEILERLQERIKDIPVVPVSNETRQGIDNLQKHILPGKTYCLLGSSGVGKSTLLNNLSGKNIMRTDAISSSTNKGRHVTSHRELILLGGGGILIDNPGMREVGIADHAGGLDITFDLIHRFGQRCRYKDCSHVHESGCAVIEAVKNGDIERASYENYLKMQREKEHFETTVYEKRKKDKQLGKILKDYHKKDIKHKRG